MPNGGICRGAGDGSTQAGEIVTCQAMATRPAGGAAVAFGEAPSARVRSERESTRRNCQKRLEVIRTSRCERSRTASVGPGGWVAPKPESIWCADRTQGFAYGSRVEHPGTTVQSLVRRDTEEAKKDQRT